VRASIIFEKIPEGLVTSEMENFLTDEWEEKLEAASGGLDKWWETLQERLKSKKETFTQGWQKWIGTGGTSPVWGECHNPEGVKNCAR